MPTNVTAPALSLCFPYDELAIRDKLFAKWPELKKLEPLHLKDLDSKMMLKDIFEMTPTIRELFTYCLYRTPRSYTRYEKYKAECTQVFNVTKYYSKLAIMFA